jgi:hypothetical protein
MRLADVNSPITTFSAGQIADRVDEAVSIPDTAAFEDPLAALEHIVAVVEMYPRIQGPQAGAEDVLRHKLAHVFWRSRVLRNLIEAIPRTPVSKRHDLLHALGALRTHIPRDLVGQLERSVEAKELSDLLAIQGVRAKENQGDGNLAGPQLDIKIAANRSSSWSFEKWSKIEEFSKYHFEGDGIRYRGVLLNPGDVMLSNCNLDGNGIYTAFVDPKAYTSHSALFAILGEGERRFPAAIETFEKGVRPVPLNVFLSPRFAAYTEVYRHTGLASEHSHRVNQAAADMIRKVKGYNFDTCDSDRDYLSCTGVPRYGLQDAGLDPGTNKSHISDKGIRKNLSFLGYEFFDFSAPVDFVLSEEYRCTGWIDNNQVEKLVARELVEVRFRHLFSRKAINPKNFPVASRINRWGIGHMRRRSTLGRIISALEGFDHVSLPKGPDDVMALIKPAEQQVGRAIKKLYPTVHNHLESLTRLDIQETHASDTIQDCIDTHLKIPWLE